MTAMEPKKGPSKRRIILCLLFCLGLIYLAWLGWRFYESGWVRDLPSFVGFCEKNAVSDATQLITYAKENLQAVVAAILGLGTGIGALLRSASQKVTAARTRAAQAENAFEEFRTTSITQAQTLEKSVQTQSDQLASLQRDLQIQGEALTKLTNEQQTWQSTNTRLQGDVNLLSKQLQEAYTKLAAYEKPPVA